MTFTQSISACMGKYATFRGRATKSEYWWFTLFVILMSWGADIVASVSLATGNPVAVILPLIVQLVFFLPSLSVGSRRLHDIGKSGWWQLIGLTIIGIIPLIIWFASDSKPEGSEFDV